MADGVNGDNFFTNLSTKLNNLYKEKNVELSQSEMQNIFNSAIKNDKDGVLTPQEFIKAAESFDAEKFGDMTFIEKSAQYDEFADIFNDIGMLDGSEGLSSADMNKMFETSEKKLPDSVFKDSPKLKTEDNKNYVEVEDYNSRKSDNNDCLTKIIRNNYDLEALGIKVGTKEYELVEKAVMDANEQIYGTEDKPGRKRIQDGQRHSSLLYTGDKVVLPDLYEIKELQEAGIKRPEEEKAPENPVINDKNPDGELVEDKNGKKVFVKGATVTTYEETPDGKIKTIVSRSASGVTDTRTENYDKNGNILSAEVLTEDAQHNSKVSVTESYEGGKLTEKIITNTNINDKIRSSDIYNYSESKGNTSTPTETTIHSHYDYKTGEETKETTTKFLATGEKHVVTKTNNKNSDVYYNSDGSISNSIVEEEKEDGRYITTTSGGNETTQFIPNEESDDHRPDPA